MACVVRTCGASYYFFETCFELSVKFQKNQSVKQNKHICIRLRTYFMPQFTKSLINWKVRMTTYFKASDQLFLIIQIVESANSDPISQVE